MNRGSEFSIRLLVVDDDQPIQSLMKAIFQKMPVIVDCVGDGDTALQRLRRSSCDAVILDLMVPGPNGFEIIREIKSRDALLLERTIVLTAAPDTMLRDFDDGKLVRRVIAKPFDIADLVAEVLSIRRALAERTKTLPPADQTH